MREFSSQFLDNQLEIDCTHVQAVIFDVLIDNLPKVEHEITMQYHFRCLSF